MVAFVELLESVNRQQPSAGRGGHTHTAENQVQSTLQVRACGVLIGFSKER